MSLRVTQSLTRTLHHGFKPSIASSAMDAVAPSSSSWRDGQNRKDHRMKNDSLLRRQFSQTTVLATAGDDDNVHVKPTIDVAKAMTIGMAEMENETLVTIAALGNHKARCEVLIRHIMAVDEVDYDSASATFSKIAESNRKNVGLAVYPYFIGIGFGMIAAFGSLPMVFDLNTALVFNEFYVTTDIPEERDLETMLEVGAWTWNWMEPPLGALSFSLLCLQYARAQLENLGLHPYTTKVINRRADKLAGQYPEYDELVIKQFSKSDPLA